MNISMHISTAYRHTYDLICGLLAIKWGPSICMEYDMLGQFYDTCAVFRFEDSMPVFEGNQVTDNRSMYHPKL